MMTMMMMTTVIMVKILCLLCKNFEERPTFVKVMNKCTVTDK